MSTSAATEEPDSPSRALRSTWLPAIAVILAVCALACWTWENWGDIRVDCGREMYVPDAMLHGKVLYGDLWYPYGPLTPYLQTTLFRLFGSTLPVLYGLGLAITISCAFLLLFISRRCLDPFASFLVVLCFLLRALQPGLFNFIVPYSYASAIGCLEALVCALCAVRYLESGTPSQLIAAGVAAGLALLTKIEFGTSCTVALLLVLGLRSILQRSWRSVPADLLYCTPGFLIAFGVYAWLTWRFSYRALFEDNMPILPSSYFMRAYGARWIDLQGFRFAPREIMLTMLSAIVSIVFWFFVTFLLRQMLKNPTFSLLAIPPIGVLMRGKLGDVLTQTLIFPRGMFWIGIAITLGALVRVILTPVTVGDTRRTKFLAISVLGVFSLLLSSRVMTKITPIGYASFYSPLLVVLFFIALWAVIQFAARGSTRVAYIALSLEGIALLICILPNSRLASVPLKTARGTINTSQENARAFSQAIQFIHRSALRAEKVLVVPEDNSLYFFAGVQSPSRWYALTPGVLPPAHEKDYIAEVERAHVEYILWSNRLLPEYGATYFGTDYNKQIGAWIRANYTVVGELGHFKLSQDSPASFLIYKRQHI